ncbi:MULTISPECIES: bifunctional transcriptional activator/DNA repair enzyme AdaA [Bacillaceae]|uniref:bifunctional transcriptional activator/DNA repair enzyme AdaA n=1 Tax=Bacillaceae TaxID=186817 RepID=UPI000BFCA3F8|nr:MULTISPECIES: Ada metal-binding domain-containing protein [Bacillaceae]MCM3164708.1 helix-turn-helix domain-containing protein [Metabacillus litoralis]PGT82949.1 AraC family transcriptional regulator [Bacillus sp. AFS040349]UGB33611.1 helix-turn-helix domain-containing protein [Metabacillus sp. B2-18]
MEEFHWKAIESCNPTYDGHFFYALTSTLIFCRPSCASRTPNKKNVQIFYSAKEAVNSGYRPCKRCKPDCLEWQGAKNELTIQVKKYILNHYDEKLTLYRIAKEINVDPYHLHRTFKAVTGYTPLQFMHQSRIEQAKEFLLTTNQSTTEISFKVGYSSPSHFSKVFKEKTGLSPSFFRSNFHN